MCSYQDAKNSPSGLLCFRSPATGPVGPANSKASCIPETLLVSAGDGRAALCCLTYKFVTLTTNSMSPASQLSADVPAAQRPEPSRRWRAPGRLSEGLPVVVLGLRVVFPSPISKLFANFTL